MNVYLILKADVFHFQLHLWCPQYHRHSDERKRCPVVCADSHFTASLSPLRLSDSSRLVLTSALSTGSSLRSFVRELMLSAIHLQARSLSENRAFCVGVVPAELSL